MDEDKEPTELETILEISANSKIPATTLYIGKEQLLQYHRPDGTQVFNNNYVMGCMYANFMNTYTEEKQRQDKETYAKKMERVSKILMDKW